MRFDTTQDGPATGGGYVPYALIPEFYQLYLQPHSRRSTQLPGQTYANYDFSSDIVSVRRHFHRPTVEQIVARGYFAPPRGRPESSIISDKEHTSWLGLESVIRQIRQRYELCERNLYEIELAKCAAMTSVFIREAELGFVAQTSREFYSLNKNIQSLYQQQREEHVTLWQDVSRLKQSLPEAAQQYLANYRKASLLEEKPGDAE